jgi:hypothetical protein
MSGVAEGLSGRQALRNYLADVAKQNEETGQRWTGIRTTVFQQQYAATIALRAAVPDAINAPKDTPSGGLKPVPRPTTRPGGYLNWSVAFTRPIGSSELETTFHPIRSNEPLTPAELEAVVRQSIEDASAEAHGSFYRYTIEGVVWTGTEELVPEERG